MEPANIVLTDALMQMCDGIHRTSRFMRIDSLGEVHMEDISYIKSHMGLNLVTVGRVEILDRMDECGARDIDMERMYGEFNTFAKTCDGNEYFAWYNNDR